MKKLTLNLEKYTTQIIYSKFKCISRQAVKNKIVRNQIKYIYVKELNLYFIEIPENERENFLKWLFNQIK